MLPVRQSSWLRPRVTTISTGSVASLRARREFVQRLRRDDDRHILGGRADQVGDAHRHAEAIGGREGQLVPREAHVDPGQHRAALVGGGGEDDLPDRLAQYIRRDQRGRLALDGRDGREILGVDAAHRRLGARGADIERQRAAVEFQLDRLVRQVADEIGQQPRRDGDRALPRRSRSRSSR